MSSRSTRALGRGRAVRLIAALAMLAGVLSIGLDPVKAVVNTGEFELDGNAVHETTDDWDNVCHEVTITEDLEDGVNDIPDQCASAANTSTATAVEWADDGSPNASIFTGGGSKDPINIDQWAWKDGSGGLPDKDNLVHSFAARYSLTPHATNCPAGDFETCEILFFGSDRFDNSGDAHQAFWFLQDEVGLGTAKLGGGTAFKGLHVEGDLLAISNFSNGGTTSTITIYEWDTDCTGADPQTQCADNNLRQLATSNTAKCAPALTLPYCGIVNSANGTTAPWTYKDKSNNTTYLQGEFFEGAINLSALGLADRCFASVVSETRSSTSTTATLKDFVVGGFGKCDSSIVTTPSVTTTSIGSGTATVTDSAVVTVDGTQTWAGSVQFSLCGPIANGVCPNKTPIGSAISIDDDTVQPIVSQSATVSSVGRYCWSSVFTSSTEGVPDAEDNSESECFNVTPATPVLTTTAGPDVDFGNPVTDDASITGLATVPGTPTPINSTTPGGLPGGTVTFTLVKADCSTLATGTGTNPQTVNVTNGTVPQVSFQPNAPGTYHWKATYTPASSDPNNLGDSHNGDCLDGNETVVVNQVPTTLDTRQWVFPQDRARIAASGGGNLAGSVRFKLYESLTECQNETANFLYDSGNVSISGASPQYASTNNTTARVSSDKTVYWLVRYTSTNQAQLSSSSVCVERTAYDYSGNDDTVPFS